MKHKQRVDSQIENKYALIPGVKRSGRVIIIYMKKIMINTEDITLLLINIDMIIEFFIKSTVMCIIDDIMFPDENKNQMEN